MKKWKNNNGRVELTFENQLSGLYMNFYNESFKYEIKGGQTEDPFTRSRKLETSRSAPATSMIITLFNRYKIDKVENNLNNDLRDIAIKVKNYNKSEQHGIRKGNYKHILDIIKKYFLDNSTESWYVPYPSRWPKDALAAFTPLEKLPTIKQLFDPS